MKKSNLIISGAAALVALIAVSGFAMRSFAAEEGEADKVFPALDAREHRQNRFMADNGNQEKVEVALATGDYQSWLETVPEDCPLREKINTDNFSRLVEAHRLMRESGDIMKELGLEGHNGIFKANLGKGRGKGMGMKQMNVPTKID